MALFLRVLLVLVGLVLTLGLVFHLGQRRLLYFPVHEPRDRAVAAARRIGLEPWLAADGTLLGWKAPHPTGHPTARLLVLHGNAGAAADRLYFRDVFQAPGLGVALDVYLLEYPGYGPRDGTATEPSLRSAAVDAVDRLTESSAPPLLLIGESLGSAVAAQAAAARPSRVAGVLLVTPLFNVPAVARRHYPFLPAFLIRDTWRTDLALPRYGGPVAFLIANHDSVVFADLGEALYASSPGPKQLWRADADHDTLSYEPGARPWGEMLAFLLKP